MLVKLYKNANISLTLGKKILLINCSDSDSDGMHMFVCLFIEKVVPYFESVLQEEGRFPLSDDAKSTMRSYCKVVNSINNASQSVGKDGRFQVFVCIGVR